MEETLKNMEIFNRLKTPPVDALKPIAGGRLKGKTDISPMWRYEAITEVFGVCGIGWKYTIDKLWTEPGSQDQVLCFALISFYHRIEKEAVWSDPIPGIGGSMLVEKEKEGLHSSDECYKMAVTDAISVALKMIGVGADVYRGMTDGSKYKQQPPKEPKHSYTNHPLPLPPAQTSNKPTFDSTIATIYDSGDLDAETFAGILHDYQVRWNNETRKIEETSSKKMTRKEQISLYETLQAAVKVSKEGKAERNKEYKEYYDAMAGFKEVRGEDRYRHELKKLNMETAADAKTSKDRRQAIDSFLALGGE